MAITNLTGTRWLLNEQLLKSPSAQGYNGAITLGLVYPNASDSGTGFNWYSTPASGNYITTIYAQGIQPQSRNVYTLEDGWIEESYRLVYISGGADVSNQSVIDFFEHNGVQVFTVTYVVANGTWEDGTTDPITEIVVEGDSPANVPSGMVPRIGYGGGAWNEDPEGAVITEDTIYTYAFTPTNYTVTYRVENGTWNDGSRDPVVQDDWPAGSTISSAFVPRKGNPDPGWSSNATWLPNNPTGTVVNSNLEFTLSFNAVPYTVTYQVVDGTWRDGSTTPITETVLSGRSPESVPHNMIPYSGYMGGEWDVDPATAVIYDNATFTFRFEEIVPVYVTVTYSIIHGTWSDGTPTPKTEEVLSGTRPENVPENMIPEEGYSDGSWSSSPYVIVYSDSSYAYTFKKDGPGPGPGPVTGLNYFTFDGENSLDFGVYIGGQFTYNAPQRDVTKVSVPGRNGDLIQDNGRFLNVQVPYSVVFMEEFLDRTDEIKAWLLSKKGYCRLTDTYHPDTFRWGRVSGGIDFTTGAFNLTGKSKIIFDCKPQRFLTSGEELVEVNGSIENPTRFASNPLIHVEGNGAGELTIGNSIIRITDIDEYVDIDCELKVVSKGAVPKSNTLIMPNYTFPTLEPGVNNIAYSGGITSVSVKGNWWTI